MDNNECEIKIEYNESFERDPLREDVYTYQDSESYECLTTDSLNDSTHGPVDRNHEDRLNLQPHESQKDLNNDLNANENTTWFQSKDSYGKLLCKFCELKYSTVQTLRYHVKNKHPEEANQLCKLIINNKRNHKHICHICKKRFKDLYDLKIHITEHSLNLFEKSCMHCYATFNTSEDLTEHVYMKHQKTSKITYMCKICGYRTLKKSHYQQHNNTHKGNKSMNCQFCDYKTNYLSNLRIHEHIHTNDKPYLCDFKNCGYRSAAKSALRSHQLKHYPEENMLFCEKCNYSTVYKQSLKKHLDSHVRNLVKLKCNGKVK